MKTKLIVVPFIETSHQNKTFFNQKFDYKFIGNINGRIPTKVGGEKKEAFQKRLNDWCVYDDYYFYGWTGKKRNNWIEFINNTNTTDKLEFYTKTYKINGIELPYPETIDNFITDCYRLKVSLIWRDDLIDNNINIYNLVSGDVAKEYVNEILTIMKKI